MLLGMPSTTPCYQASDGWASFAFSPQLASGEQRGEDIDTCQIIPVLVRLTENNQMEESKESEGQEETQTSWKNKL